MRRYWTEPEVTLLKDSYPDTRTADVAEKIGRSVEEIYRKADALGLKKFTGSKGDHMMPVHIVRPIGKHDFLPAYSTDELLRGVCHITRIPYIKPQNKGVEERVARFVAKNYAARKASLALRQAKSRAKYEDNKAAIHEMLVSGIRLKLIAKKYHTSEQVLKRYLEEEQPKHNGARYPYLERLRKVAKERKAREGSG